jgi:hypothetical protein
MTLKPRNSCHFHCRENTRSRMDGWTEERTDKERDRDGRMDGWTGRCVDGRTNGQASGRTDRQADGQTDGQTEAKRKTEQYKTIIATHSY